MAKCGKLARLSKMYSSGLLGWSLPKFSLESRFIGFGQSLHSPLKRAINQFWGRGFCRSIGRQSNAFVGAPRLRHRLRQRGSMLVFSLWLTVLIFVMSISYLDYLHRERRFSGIQERNLQAWYLAQSGCDYFRKYCEYGSAELLLAAPDNTCKKVVKTGEGNLLARVFVPKNSKHSYFEITAIKPDLVCVRGVVYDTLSSSGGGKSLQEKRLYFNCCAGKGWDYAAYEVAPGS